MKHPPIDCPSLVLPQPLLAKIIPAIEASSLTASGEAVFPIEVCLSIGKFILDYEQIAGRNAETVEYLSCHLLERYPGIQRLSPRNLRRMRDLAADYPDAGMNCLSLLSWHHVATLMDRIKDPQVRLFYAMRAWESSWSRDTMLRHIVTDLHNREGRLLNNFASDAFCLEADAEYVRQQFKDPYIFDFIDMHDHAREKEIEEALLGQLHNFQDELGPGFGYMGNQRKLKVHKTGYSFDLLFYHARLKRYILIDLKVRKFQPEYIGKMNFYLGAFDHYHRQKGDGPSIGLLLCRHVNPPIAELALLQSTHPIGISNFMVPLPS